MEQTQVTHDYISAILNNDSTLLREMCRQIFPMVKNLIQKNGGTEDDAKDVFQDAVRVVYDRARLPDFQLTSQFSTFIYGISCNLWRSRRKKKSYTEVTIPDDAQYTADGLPELDYEQLERQKLYDKAFAQLGEDCQELLSLFFQKLSMTEIAHQMGYASENYARRRKHMCKERLIKLVKNNPEYGELRND